MKKVDVTLYKWAGNWGPFRIKTECEECTILEPILKKMVDDEFGQNAKFEVRPWLNNWMHCLKRLAYHPPIVFVDDRLVFQYQPWKKLPDMEHIREVVREGVERLQANE